MIRILYKTHIPPLKSKGTEVHAQSAKRSQKTHKQNGELR